MPLSDGGLNIALPPVAVGCAVEAWYPDGSRESRGCDRPWLLGGRLEETLLALRALRVLPLSSSSSPIALGPLITSSSSPAMRSCSPTAQGRFELSWSSSNSESDSDGPFNPDAYLEGTLSDKADSF